MASGPANCGTEMCSRNSSYDDCRVHRKKKNLASVLMLQRFLLQLTQQRPPTALGSNRGNKKTRREGRRDKLWLEGENRSKM